MKIKRLKKLKVHTYYFDMIWDKTTNDASVSYSDKEIMIGIRGFADEQIFSSLCHEIFEVCAIEMHVRLNRPDCYSDFVFVFDHRQHDSMMEMFSGLVSQFIA